MSTTFGLTVPRFLARLPYGSKTQPVDEFDFEEDVQDRVESKDRDKFCWANSAYAMATNIARAFNEFGWCARINGVEGGGAVEALPTFAFPTDDGGVDMKCPTEIGITDRRQHELHDIGFMALLHKKNTDFAAFISAPSMHKPLEYDDPDATTNAILSARLPYLFAACRFAHYLKCIARDKIGSFRSREDMERFLNRWMMDYVTASISLSDDEKARHPLAEARIAVEEVEGNSGYYTLQLYLRPHYQLEGLTASLRLVSRLPSVTGA